MTSAAEYLSETVLYGGVPVGRAEMEAHLDQLGVTGPARLVYGCLPAVDREPGSLGETRSPLEGDTDE